MWLLVQVGPSGTSRGFNPHFKRPPEDGTKNVAPIGIIPSGLFLVSAEKTIPTKQAGTLYLGINDCCGSTNGGGFTVEVTFIPVT
jgi:hypothetical protein